MEKFLTTSPEDFATLMRKSPSIVKDEQDSRREAYRYGKVFSATSSSKTFTHHCHCQSEKFVMRSQLDCVDARLPGTGVFDIKTRAALPIRMDLLNYEVMWPLIWAELSLSPDFTTGKLGIPDTQPPRTTGKLRKGIL